MQQVWIKVSAHVIALALIAAVMIGFSGHPQATLMIVALGVVVAAQLFLARLQLAPLEEITRGFEALSRGRQPERELTALSGDELGRLAHALNQTTLHQRELTARLNRLARGEVGAIEHEERALSAGRVEDTTLGASATHSEQEQALTQLTVAMRRAALQVRLVARDQLEHKLLDERAPGELGDALHAMVTHLRGVTARAKQIAQGDLSTGGFDDGEGVLKGALQEMVMSQRAVIDELVQVTMHISTSAEQILTVLREQEFSASHQASGVEETQRTMETLLAAAKKIAESAQTVFKSAERTQANNRTIADRASELKSHTERIGEILETIKSIADRSDLLALNASLEGLRAGEAGKGFTLVAGEMRRLAENIKESVGAIKELLSDIRESALSSVLAIDDGTRLSERTTESALKISLITQQQQSGTEQVTQSMEELSHLINQGLAGTRQVTTAASDLAQLAEHMRVLIDGFSTIAGLSRALRTTNPRLGEALGASQARAQAASHANRTSSPRLDVGRQARALQHTAPASPRAATRGEGRTSTPTGEPRVEARAEAREPRVEVKRTSIQRQTNPELNATMRFVGYEEHADALTLDMTRLAQAGAPSGAPVNLYGEVDDLFEELDRSSPSSPSDESMEDKFDAIERGLTTSPTKQD